MADTINPRAARRSVGLTQSQAASLIGAALRTWQDWESGARNMPPAKWAYFCILVGYDPTPLPAAPSPR